MRTRALWLCALLAAVVPRGVAGALDVKEIVRKVQARYDATTDFTADVRQEMTITSMGKTTTAQGTVAFKKPGKMRWELTQGDPQVIVADGKTLWLYQPKEQQVLKTPFDAAFKGSTPISFLTGVGHIDEDFEVSLDGESPDGQRLYLMLLPRRDSQSVGRLRLEVGRDTGTIYGAEIHDPLGNVSHLHFDRVQQNVGVPDDRFVFQVPPGVDVITAPLGP